VVGVLAVSAVMGVAAPAEAGASGCAAGRAQLRGGKGGTVIVGDSLTVGEWCAGGAKARWRGPVTVDARVGRGTAEGLRIAGRLGSGAATIVLALGTNDAAGGARGVERWERSVRRFAQARPHVRVWLVRLVVPGAGQRAYNDAIARLDWEPNISVVEWVPRAKVLSRDGVHLWGDGAAGYRERAAVIAAVVQG
jgi:hypothetical protein